MIRKKANEIYRNLIKDQAAISDMDVYDADIYKIIEIISNECKSTISDDKGNLKRFESVLSKEMVRNLITQFFKNSNIVNNTAIRDVMTIYYEPELYELKDKDESKIIGPTNNIFIEKKISTDGSEIEEVNFKSPISENIGSSLLGEDVKQSEKIKNLVLEPFVEKMIQENDSLRKKHPIRTFISKLFKKEKTINEMVEDYIEILSENLEPKIAKNTANYTIKNLLMNPAIYNDIIQKAEYGKLIVDLSDNSKGYTALKNQMTSEILDITNSSSINPTKGLETIEQLYSDILAQLKVMTNSIEGKEAKEIENLLKEINKKILPDFKYREDSGYRKVEVGMKSAAGMINVVPAKHVDKSMENLSKLILETMENKDSLSKEEYVKEVSKTHYRFIRIHPFPDGNGRTGRALINMMLEPIGENIVFDKEQKHKYMRALNFQHNRIDSTNKEEYLESLYNNPGKCNEYEEGFDYLLEEFIGDKLNLEYRDRAITEELER